MTAPVSNISHPNISLYEHRPVRAAIFACRWCALLGADRAGRERLELPASFRLIPVECAAGVEPDLVLRALADGFDGVAVLGCHLGGCRHNEANRAARLRLSLLRDLLDVVGLDGRRLLLSWGTAHEGFQFAGLVRNFLDVLAALQPVHPELLPLPDFWADNGQEDGHKALSHGCFGWTAVPGSLSGGKAMLDGLREKIARLLSEEVASPALDGGANLIGVLGLREEDGAVAPHLFTSSSETEHLVFEPKWPLAKTAWLMARSLPDGASVGLVCRGCDMRALIELEKAGQLRPGTVRAIGLDCSEDQAAACRCEKPYFPGGPREAEQRPATINALPPEPGRLDFWRDHFSRCIKCYGCRNACPLCVCPTCKLEDDGYVTQGRLPPDPLAFHLIRAMHLADRCVGCGACQESCPSGLPLLDLHLAMRGALRKRTGYVSGTVEPSPLLIAGSEDGPLWEDTLETGRGGDHG